MSIPLQSPRHMGNKKTKQKLIVEEKIIKENGEGIVRRYEKMRFLGRGGFARCYEFKNLETGNISAVKILSKASLTKNRTHKKLMSEIKIHRSLHHENIVAFKHYFEDNENVYILLELCQNQTLNELLKRRKRLTELEAKSYMLQIIQALKYLHSHKVIHRDLKLGNLFLTEKMELKVGDFGLATKKEFKDDGNRTICGTPNYIAPEMLDGKSGPSYEVDIWSLGVILYTMIVGKHPFETPDIKSTYRRIKNISYSFPDHVHISDNARNLITSILVLDSLKRPTLDQFLEHPFFSEGGRIPKLLPMSTMVSPPSVSFLKQFIGSEAVITKLESASPIYGRDLAKHEETFADTDKLVFRKSDSFRRHTDGRLCSARSKERELYLQGPTIWIKKWVDYSSKYGLGYLLSNDSPGVFFNDSSKIVLDPNGHDFSYIQTKSGKDVITNHSLTHYPKELEKKVLLLKNFKNYFESDSKYQQPKFYCLPYVEKWMRTRHAIMFQFSNKVIQMIFHDHTEIIMSSDSREVAYVNKKKERTTIPLSFALDSNNLEFLKRLKYTKDTLAHMFSSVSGTQSPSYREIEDKK